MQFALDLPGGYHSRVVRTDLAAAFKTVGSQQLTIVDGGLPERWRSGIEGPQLILPPGESCKEISVLDAVLRGALALGLTRDTRFLVVGGGAATDLGAFAASIYLRGVPLILVPTTLLAMVDAAVGGKTAIDFGGFKNIVGSFYPATEVRIVPAFVNTLSEREYRSGLAEVIKAAMLADTRLFEILESEASAVLNRDESVVAECIERAIAVKVQVVQADFYERGERAFLNLGHTFAHALEAVSGLGQWSHGEAVAWGTVRALHAGLALGITARSYVDRAEALFQRYGYRLTAPDVDPMALIAAMQKDKKRTSGGLSFVLQADLGETLRAPVAETVLRDILEA